MLPKQRRVSQALFQEVMQRGKSFHAPHMSLRLLYKDGLTTSHFAVSVPKKVSSKAVERNRIRRRLYPLIRGYEQRLTFPAVAIFFAKNGSIDASRDVLQEEVKGLLSRAFNIVL
jgi:ribonuclease P protein component